jgi:hypothetical protein
MTRPSRTPSTPVCLTPSGSFTPPILGARSSSKSCGQLLRELPQMQALLADIPATFVVHDHCVLACTPIDHWHGSTNKPTQYAVIGYDTELPLPESYRCAKTRLPTPSLLDADACHCLVQQLPAKRHRQDGQIRVDAESAARIPVGVFQFAFPSRRDCVRTPTCGPVEPYPAAAPTPPPVDLAPYGAYLGLRCQPTIDCVASRHSLACTTRPHSMRVRSHPAGQRLADSANQWQGFRMLNASGQLISAPNITAADVRLDAHCDTCTRTQMQAAPSHSSSPTCRPPTRCRRRLPCAFRARRHLYLVSWGLHAMVLGAGADPDVGSVAPAH